MGFSKEGIGKKCSATVLFSVRGMEALWELRACCRGDRGVVVAAFALLFGVELVHVET